MSWEICMPGRFIDGILVSKNVCFVIPDVVPRFPPDLPQPPWIRSELLNEEFTRDLQRLAAIDELASGLSSGLKKQVQSLVRGAAREPKALPADFELNFGPHDQRS